METMALFFSITSIWFYTKANSIKKREIIYYSLAFVFMLLGALVTPRILVLYVGFAIPYLILYRDTIPWKSFILLTLLGAASYFLYLHLAFGGLFNAFVTLQNVSKEFMLGSSKLPLLYDKYYLFISILMLLSSGWIFYKKLGDYKFFIYLNISVLLYANLVAQIFTETGVYYTLYIFLILFVAIFDIFYLYKFGFENKNPKVYLMLMIFFVPILYKSSYSILVQTKRVVNEIRSLEEYLKSEEKLILITNYADSIAGPSSLYSKFLSKTYLCVDIEREQENRVNYILDTLAPQIIMVDDELKRRQPIVFNSLINSKKYNCFDSILLTYNVYTKIDSSKFGFWLNQNNVRILRKK